MMSITPFKSYTVGLFELQSKPGVQANAALIAQRTFSAAPRPDVSLSATAGSYEA